ncbi:MAG: 3,4-dihydroxy-2-butanone-4-phosphate synthase [Halobacteriovoraceae bacterium]|nr:3,4-dihydroxy-2-butanone-4-phosphate synthase [Halobacteriovoraceae bacterium]|tara:strand:- start:34210 stop:34869 length:660 start_codon:yes stop_codon:yes gene_type:complete
MLNTIEETIPHIQAGKMTIVVDDESRENEGDLFIPAQVATRRDINFMVRRGRGLICAPLTQKIAFKLDLPLMVPHLEDQMKTAFTLSVDASEGISTGISAQDRALTLNKLADLNATAKDFVRPGHIFPLIAKDDGVLARPGHTEAAVDLSRMSGFSEVGVICEILTEDGSAARMPYLLKMAKKYNLKIISIEDLITFQLKNGMGQRIENEYFNREFNLR